MNLKKNVQGLWMIKRRYLAFLVTLFFVGCSVQPHTVKPNEKAFDAEDAYIMYALRAEQVGSTQTAAKLFDELYKKSSKKEYLYRSLKNLYISGEYEKILHTIASVEPDPLNDRELARIKVVTLARMGKIEEAQNLSIALAKKTSLADDYLLVADMLLKTKRYEDAVRYLDSAYMKGYDEKVLDKLAIILYVNLHRTKDAIARLETHTRLQGCSERICNRLIGIYSNENNIQGLLSVYKRKYALNHDSEIAQKIIQIYAYKRDYVKLMNFLESSHEDDSLLLELYVSAKDFQKAYRLAQKLYEKEGLTEYLGQSAIYEYEANKNKLDNTVLSSVVTKLEDVVQKNNDPLYKNYLGYILIDHDMDVARGMRYVRDVLKVKPDSGYYLDSLAWGYYKLGKCKKARKLMQKVRKLEGGDDPEVTAHIKKIDQCLKGKL